jgi:rod shape-determining protein MreC
MDSFFVRYRNLLVLLAILLAQIVGLAVQVRRVSTGRYSLDRNDGPGVRLIRLWADALVTPPERAIHNSRLGMGWLWTNYVDLRNVRKQNHALEQTIDRLRMEQAALLEDAKQGQRLQALLGFRERYIYTTVAAQVIGSSGSEQARVFYIDKGSHAGLKPDMAVITGDGIVGKVRDVFPDSAQVLAVNDQTSGAGVILETTRIRGILRGDADGQLMIVGILADERIQPGEKVLTAGGDLIFPRGLPVGVVEKVERDPNRDAFIDVMVKPAAHLDRLDEVLVITSTQPRFSPQEQQDIAGSESSVSLKGPDAQSIEEQLKASEINAEKLPGVNDVNAPAGSQAGQNPANPAAEPPAPKLLPTLHPDRFSPGAATTPGNGPSTASPDSNSPPKTGANGAAQPGSKSGAGRNP